MQGLELSHDDCDTVRSLASDAGLQDLSVAQIFRAATAQADARGALSQASFFELMRVLVPRQRLALEQREKFSGILSQLFGLYDWAGDNKVHVQVSETPLQQCALAVGLSTLQHLSQVHTAICRIL